MELIDVYDENGTSLNYSLDRKEVHDKNLWHHHVSAWIMNYDGKVLLQQRALDKKRILVNGQKLEDMWMLVKLVKRPLKEKFMRK